VYSAWEETISPEPHEVNIIKVHNIRELDYFHIIFTTRRDLRDIAASFVRMGWCRNNTRQILKICDDVVKKHEYYSPVANLEIPYEEMQGDKIGYIERICSVLKQPMDCERVSKEVDLLTKRILQANKILDIKTQIHRNHIGTRSRFEILSKSTIKAIESDFSCWLAQFGSI
jgi:hypothetical protein